MLRDSLKLIKEELKSYIDANKETNAPPTEVILRNIALLESEIMEIEEGIIITLVNTEEERTLKNVKTAQRVNFNNSVSYQNPPIHLNLYILFSANFTSGAEPYERALNELSYIIRFFQKKNVFTLNTSTSDTFLSSIFDSNKNDIRLIFNLYSVTFEQLNHLWGSLGGKQLPSVMYRCWLVELKDEQLSKTGALIEEIQSQEKIK